MGPAGLGMWPSGHRLVLDGSDLLLESVLSCLGSTQARARLAGLREAGRPAFGLSHPSIVLTLHLYACDRPWVLDC